MWYFHPAVTHWFNAQFAQATKPQERGWPAIQAGADVLIAAPTGSGKTLAAFLACLDRLFKRTLAGDLPNLPQIVYVSPLRALSNDIQKNLAEPLAGIQQAMFEGGFGLPEIRVGLRTGDTSQKDRQALIRRPPHILVTTPESLFLLVTSESGRKLMSQVETLILDEIHAVADDRRGAHLMLSVERLAALSSKRLQRIGLSATQRPMELVAQFLVGGQAKQIDGSPECVIVDEGHLRELDLAVEIPDSPLEAVMSHEVWAELHLNLVRQIQAHKTTLIFVNTRRLAERVTHQLSQQLGEEQIAAHHGSLSSQIRLDAEMRLKTGKLKAIVATASLELGIDIGHVDLVCQIGSPRAIATFLQRVGRSGHYYGGLPKGRIYPLTRDELLECTALVRAVHRQELDCLLIPEEPVDILAQQIVAAVANEDWKDDALFELVRRAYPYRNLSREQFDKIVHMLNDGFTTKRGRRGAQLHYDGVNGVIRGRKGSRLTALTCGGAIPDVADYNVILEPEGTFIGTLNEDFAVESTVGDIFQLGNSSWMITKVAAGTVRVADAHGAPPTIPFWLGEAPGRTMELSAAVGRLRTELAGWSDGPETAAQLAASESAVSEAGWSQMLAYVAAGKKALGAVPSQDTIILERFFDEAGGMQLVIHAPFGMRVNRAWGLALRKRFCRSFNFELQAAATDDAIVLSLGPKHSFPLEEVFEFLRAKTVREVLVQALLDAPMFGTRWRWNAYRSLALLRQRGGKRVPPQIQRMESEDFLAVVFPDQLACLENIVGDREVPDHPLAQQTVKDCLTEAMDIEGLEALLRRLEAGELQLLAVDVPEPSVFAHEVLTAKPYAFLDDAPLEERRTQAVLLRRAIDQGAIREDGILDAEAIEQVRAQAWPRPESEDEVHEALVQLGGLDEAACQEQSNAGFWRASLENLEQAGRATCFRFQEKGSGRERRLRIAAERLPLWQALFTEGGHEPRIRVPRRESSQLWDKQSACLELIRGRLEVSGPTSARRLHEALGLPIEWIDAALLTLEAEGMVLRGRFEPQLPELQWCNRRLLARIHQLTVQRLRQEIKAVTAHEALRFFFHWQRATGDNRGRGLEGLEAVATLLEGFEAPAAAWESDLLKLRMAKYDPSWLDQLCLTGRIRWGRLSAPTGPRASGTSPIKTTPITLFSRENEGIWLGDPEETLSLSGYAALAYEVLAQRGALFFAEIRDLTGMLATQVELALGELVALGLAGSDSFAGLRALLRPSNHKPSLVRAGRHRPAPFAPLSIEYAGRWSLLHGARAARLLPLEPLEMPPTGTASNSDAPVSMDQARPPAATRKLSPRQPFDLEAWKAREARLEYQAHVLLRRYGLLFRRLIDREEHAPKWRELLPVLRRLEAIGEIRGGYFVEGFGGEHFALPEAIVSLRAIRKKEADHAYVVVGACDPLNLAGVLTPGAMIQRSPANRILFQNGLPLAAIQGGELVRYPGEREQLGERTIRAMLELGNLQTMAGGQAG